MAATRDFEAELAAVNAAGELVPEEALPVLRKALSHRNNLIVSRAARHAEKLKLTALLPDLVAAFHRFMPPPTQSNPTHNAGQKTRYPKLSRPSKHKSPSCSCRV